MKFEDCEVGQAISITLTYDGNKMTMQSKILNILDGCLVVEPFKVNGIIVDFPGKVDIEMMVIRPEDIPYYWQKIFVARKIYHEQDVHIVTSKLPGVRMNRRNSFRVFIGNTVKLSGASENPMNVTLHNLSTGGFSFETNKDLDIPLHSRVVIEYSDNKYQKYYELPGRPIRKDELEHMNIYGCILDGRGLGDLQNYLNEKQMEHRPNKPKDK